MTYRAGRHFLQLPGPSNLPDRVLRALDRAVIDHRGPEFARKTKALLASLRAVFRTEEPVIVYPASGTGGWEAALTNTLSPGDRVLAFDHGHFARRWSSLATRLGLESRMVPGDWRHPVGPESIAEALADDPEREIRAVMIVHNETSTGVVTDIGAVRAAMDQADHPALLLVDAVSSLGSMEYLHDEWRVDVTVAGSQKGLMLPPGLAFNAVSAKARTASASAGLQRGYWDWQEMLDFNERGIFPYTPATNLLYALEEALAMLEEEGPSRTFARHRRYSRVTRAAVNAWGLETVCADPKAHSPALTAVYMPAGHDADQVRAVILDRFDMSLGKGLGELLGRAFRIGHLGDFNELSLAGTLAGVEMGLASAGVPIELGGVQAAMKLMTEEVGR